MTIKNMICTSVAAVLAVSVCSCGKKNSGSSASESTSASSSASETSDAGSSASESEEASASESEAASSESGSKNTDSDDVRPPLWKVTDPETGNEMYLLGTIHVVEGDSFEIPEHIMDIYENCEGIAVEYDVDALESDFAALQELMTPLVYADGSTIQDHISEKAYENGKKLLEEYDSYSPFLDVYNASYWVNIISSLQITSLDGINTDGVDSTFMTMAKKDGKDVISIETLETESAIFNAYSDELAEYILETADEEDESEDEIMDDFRELYDHWKNGEVDAMIEDGLMENDDLPEDLVDDCERYNDIVLFNRNKVMAERAAEFIKDGKNYLFMVGSAHYAGKEGVDDILEDMGFTVEKIA